MTIKLMSRDTTNTPSTPGANQSRIRKSLRYCDKECQDLTGSIQQSRRDKERPEERFLFRWIDVGGDEVASNPDTL